MARKKENFIYAVYKGKYLVAEGTVSELAKKLGVKENTIYLMASQTYKKRDKGNRKLAYKVNEETGEIDR